jgi:hypothetical protein
MKTFKILPILTLVLLLGCGEEKMFFSGDAVLVQTDPNAAPYSVKVISKQQDNYTVEVYSSLKVISVPNNQMLRRITDASQELIAVYDWNENKANLAKQATPERQAELKLGQKLKTQCFFFGFLPLMLLAVAYMWPTAWLVGAPYVFCCIMFCDPFTFFCILFFFFFMSVVAWSGCTFLMSGFGVNTFGMVMGTICYLILMFMFFTYQG